jgi:hypothetical protein
VGDEEGLSGDGLMASDGRRVAGQQRLGRRLGLRPYYTVAERGPALLRLESQPGANRPLARGLFVTGALLLAAAALIIVSALYAAGSGAGFAVAALGAVVGGLLGAVGYQRALGGYAVASTRNTVVADAAQRTLSFTQGNRLAPVRTQSLPFDAVRAIRLRRRPYRTGGPLGRVQPVVALELVTEGDEVWIVDSAEGAEQLRPVAEGLSEILGMELAQG